ncbi:MAG: CAP domain-containing protein [Parcubacteria group bacterium]|jgi:uncharacterized protein YkwD
MTNKKIYYGAIILIIAGIFLYFKPDLNNLRHKAENKLAQMENGGFESVASSIKKQVYAPPPLRSNGKAILGKLTRSGTIDETNVQRKDNSLSELKENKKLDESAMLKAKDIINKQYFDHISPDGTGPSDLADQVNYQYLIIGENLALGGFENDKSLVEAWMNSPGHRENILNTGFREIGVAVIEGNYEGARVWVAVQEFGTGASFCPPVSQELKDEIDANQDKISGLKDKIDSQKKNINSLDASNKTAYQEAVSAYNKMIGDYNGLVKETKTMAANFNNQVEKYNSCLKAIN